MGRKCCYNSYSCCPPCYNPCCPPLFCPPYNPCASFCNPCYDFDCCCDSCNTKGKSYFNATSSDPLDISGLPAPYVVTFNEQQDCLCEYINNTTFSPKCKGYYNFKVNVTLTQTATLTQTVTVALVVNGVTKASSQFSYTTSGQSNTFIINQNICLNKCDNVYVTVSPTTSLQLTQVRSFCGSKCGSSGSSCCSSSCCH